jgi:3-hydroxyisobutyrate dehydrogenase-like beta-hydroxyacid dehydrogenase
VTARIGIIGLGEAGWAIATGLRRDDNQEVTGYDIALSPARKAEAEALGIEIVSGLEPLAEKSQVIICLAHASVAVSVSAQISPFLGETHIYSDWNSASPLVKREAAEAVAARGAGFADGAVMAAVLPRGHRVPVLLSGDGAEDFRAVLAGTQMNLEVVGTEPGQASATKMFRSLLVKGIEALLLEFAAGADAYGITDRVLASLNESFRVDDWANLAPYLLERSMKHGSRRAEELRQVAQTLADAGIDPLMARAGADRLQWLADLQVAPLPQAGGFGYAAARAAIAKAVTADA